MSVQLRPLSCFFLLSLIGRRAWPNDAGPQGNNEKNLMIQDPNPYWCFSVFYVITMSYCVFFIYTYVLTLKMFLVFYLEHYMHASSQPQHFTNFCNDIPSVHGTVACCRQDRHVSGNDMQCGLIWSSLRCSVILSSLWEPMWIWQCFPAAVIVCTLCPKGSVSLSSDSSY